MSSESPLFKRRKSQLRYEESTALEAQQDIIEGDPKKAGIHRPDIRKDVYTRLYGDPIGKKVIGYEYKNKKVKYLTVERISLS